MPKDKKEKKEVEEPKVEAVELAADDKKAHDAEKAQKREEANKKLDVSQNSKVLTKASFGALIDAYKVKNPIKYALKKERLEKKLATLK